MARTADIPNNDAVPAIRRDRRRSVITGFVATVGALVLASTALSATPTLVDATTGLTAPAGILRDANDDIWVSDSHGGICRVLFPHPGAAPTVAVDQYCDPAAVIPRTNGPIAPGQFAFDPATRNIFVGDVASGNGAVWRMHLDDTSDPAVIDSSEKILDFGVTDRVLAVAYHDPSGGLDPDVLDVATKRSPNILRIVHPATCIAPCDGVGVLGIFGSAETSAVGSMTHDANGRLYLADLSGVTSIDPMAGLTNPPGRDTQARPVSGMAGAYSALAYDPVTDGGMIYAGTTNLEGVDQIDRMRVSTGEISTFVGAADGGFDAVTAISVNPGTMNGLDVIDDPGIKQVGEDLGGTARRFTVPPEAFQPRPVIVDGPADVGNRRSVNFVFTYVTPNNFLCSIDGAPATSCGTGAVQGSFQAFDLSDGVHIFKVQVDNTITGQAATRRFVVDTKAPTTSIDGVTVGAKDAFVSFSADDVSVDFSCRLDGGAAAPCDSPAHFGSLVDGDHTVTVQATDFVGNAGPVVSTTFRVGPPPAQPWKPGVVSATLTGRKLRVVFNAPPGTKFARFVITKKSVYPVRTKAIKVHGGKKNTITITLSRAEAARLDGKNFKIRVDAGVTSKNLSVKAGSGKLNIKSGAR